MAYSMLAKGRAAKEPEQSWVWLLTRGDWRSREEWVIESIHSTEQGAIAAKAESEVPRVRADGSSYVLRHQIEKWPLLP